VGHVLLGARAADGRVLVEVEHGGSSLERGAPARERSGIALVRKAIEAIGGGLHEKRNAHGGSLFTIDFPQKVPRERRQASKRS
jgi:two-component sensor histidine kinase